MQKLNLKRLFTLLGVIMLSSLVTFTSCKKDDDDDDDDTTIVLDGMYVMGDATAVADLDEDGMMAVTRNEVTQTERSTLYELYIAVKATGGFNIVMVDGDNQTTYGPGTDFADVTQGTTDEPQVTFQRGSYMETEDQFTVPADGMYHVAIDTEVGKVVIVPVHWGVIGAATPDGWGTSTDLTESTFDLNTMSWSITGMELRSGDWKFRYSNGWKVELDTVLDLGNGDVGVKVNTNFGGAVDALEPGGANIVNADPGVYDIEISYTLGTGYTATATKTGGLPLTNWTGVKLDIVGDGVSSDNATAIADTSSWGWGNQMLADNNGEPTVNGDVYTWTWTGVVLEASSGWKVRTWNGVAPASGGANFDAGFSSVDVANSSSLVADDNNNITVTSKATFDITMVIDAADNDSKTITIVEQ